MEEQTNTVLIGMLEKYFINNTSDGKRDAPPEMLYHGRFPDLHVWLRIGRRMPVEVPPGYLIAQAGKQIEYLQVAISRAASAR